MAHDLVILYSFPSCNSSRRVKSWLELNKIKFTERKVLREPILKDEILHILQLTSEGFDEIISEKNVGQGKIGEAIEDLSSNQLMEFICQNPNMLKKPILVYNGQLLVGWNKTKFRQISPSHKTR